MTSISFIVRNLRYFWRTHLGAVLAAALSSTVLIGALLIGDSVRYTLRQQALERVGPFTVAVTSGEKFFSSHLAARLNALNASSIVQAVLSINGIAIHDENESRAPRVQMIGIGPEFLSTTDLDGYNSTHPFTIQTGEVLLNAPLAAALQARIGDVVRLRIPLPSAMPLDVALEASKQSSAVVRAKVAGITREHGLGRFSLQASQRAPYNIFIPLADLQKVLRQPDKANLLLIANKDHASETIESTNARLKKVWKLEDAGLKLRMEPELGFIEISTPRVFIDDELAAKLSAQHWQGLTTYFVNALRSNGKETPYSMLTAGLETSTNSATDEIKLNDWTASDLAAKVGDKIEIEYFALGLSRKIESRKASFILSQIVPIEKRYADRQLMPEFPGIADVDTTHDWDSSLPIDMKKIRDKDETYWKQYRGTPKSFISGTRGRELFSNSFGTYTALRRPLDKTNLNSTFWEQEILSALQPSDAGINVLPLRETALAAANQSLDFGPLFIGFSFFLIFSALLLLSLVFILGIEARATQIGILKATGWSARRVHCTLWIEGICVALLGIIAGVPLSFFYLQWLLSKLTTSWVDAVGTSAISFHAEPSTVVCGVGISIFCASVVLYWTLRKLMRRSALELLTDSRFHIASVLSNQRRQRFFGLAGILVLLSGILFPIIFLQNSNRTAITPIFFASGALLLASGLMVSRWFLGRVNSSLIHEKTSSLRGMWNLGVRSASRQMQRSLAVISLLACGVFLIVSVSVNHQGDLDDASQQTSGTGGFSFYAETTTPIIQDLNTPEGRASLGVEDESVGASTFYAFRVHAGDEASCRNLHRAQHPRIMGAKESFLQRGGFQFVASIRPEKEQSWLAHLSHKVGNDEIIPAVCDIQSLTWALGKNVGDVLEIPDAKGRLRKIQIVGAIASSILQGSLIVSELDFVKLFPDESGYQMFLIDSSPKEAASLPHSLQTSLQDEGLELMPTQKRLAAFNAVANTYLSTFRVVGGLGLLLGSVGLGLIVLRNMLERRRELGLLRALGFSRRQIFWIVFSEHLWLLLLGIFCGCIAASVAVFPIIYLQHIPIHWSEIVTTGISVTAVSVLSTFFATFYGVRKPIIQALQEE
jgi:ABC-type antimicrobial peptide transport system permease subunit